MSLCSQCSEAVRGGSRNVDSNAQLSVVSTGSGTIGGRRVEATVFRCSLCSAMWQRETDVGTLKEVWYLKAGL
jgi:hypothetical protein